MKSTKLLIVISLFSMLISCEDEVVKPPEARIKRKLVYDYITDENPYKILDYHYDSKLRLEKITHGDFFYEAFNYNNNNQLLNINAFQNGGESYGWLLHDSTGYNYENGLLISQETFYFPSFERNLYTFEYKHSLLVRKCNYYNQNWGSYTSYNYEGNLCTTETMYDDTINQRVVGYTEHSYESGKLSLSKVFTWNGLKYQEIYYTYNENGDLIIEESKRLSQEIAKPFEYVYKYEYY